MDAIKGIVNKVASRKLAVTAVETWGEWGVSEAKVEQDGREGRPAPD